MRIFAVIVFTVFNLNAIWAQNTAKADSIPEKKHKVSATIQVDVGDDKVKQEGDTTKIRLGKKEIMIIESENDKHVNIKSGKIDDDKWKDDDTDDNKFDGHWAGIDLGVNGFSNEDYSMYGGVEFMELKQPKSLELNINFLEYNINLQQNSNHIGLVTGMGLSYNNYKFENPYSIDKINGMIEPVLLDEDKLKKSKLTVTYLTVPVMLECHFPINNHSDKLFIAGGIEGGLNIGSHTKIKWNHKKEKDRGSFNLNTFKYAVICKVGINNVSLYATYNLSPLFKDNKGPELTPFSVGITVISF